MERRSRGDGDWGIDVLRIPAPENGFQVPGCSGGRVILRVGYAPLIVSVTETIGQETVDRTQERG